MARLEPRTDRGVAVVNCDEWQRRSPLKTFPERPGMEVGMLGFPEPPVHWMMCFGKTVSSMCSSSSSSSGPPGASPDAVGLGCVVFTKDRRMTTFHDLRALSYSDDTMVERSQMLRSSALAYDSNQSASLSLGVKIGQVSGKGR